MVDSFDDFTSVLDITSYGSVDASRMDAGMKACVGEFLGFFAAKSRARTGVSEFSDCLEALKVIWLEWSLPS